MKMTKLTLNADGQHLPGKPKDKVTGIVVEVDMLDSEKTPHRTAEVSLTSRGEAQLRFDKAYDATPQSKLGKAYAKALETKEEGGQRVQFNVYVPAKEGRKEVLLGVARCSLEKLVNRGKDHVGSLTLEGDKGLVLGSLECSVEGVDVLTKQTADEAELLQPIRTTHRISVDVSKLTLDARVVLPRKNFVVVEILFPQGAATASSKPLHPDTRNACAIAMREEFAPTPGSKLALALAARLAYCL